jgi:hypothetical protein
MKTFALFLCLIATTADAAPLYLTCEGKRSNLLKPSEAKQQISQSIRIEEQNLWFEGSKTSIHADGGDTLSFSGGGIIGTLNRITGRVEVSNQISFSVTTMFEGVCHKTEKLF